jgi:UDP-2,3-diacylglucosamine hydrolase
MKIYFASDQHFGAPTREKSKEREALFVQWLDQIERDATHLFLLGDLFDFWFEYKKVIPKGFVRVLGKLAQLRDKGIEIHFFTGNHDLWMKDYFETELGISVYHEPKAFTFSNKKFLIGHGDGLGPGDRPYKLMNRVFKNGVAQWLFRWLHPDLGVRLAQYLSTENKLISGEEDVKFLGEDKEMLIQYCKEIHTKTPYDYYVFGHRHLPMEIPIGEEGVYINTGDWISYYSYVIFDGETLTLTYFNPKEAV